MKLREKLLNGNTNKEINHKDMNMKLRNIPFSPPDMTENEAAEVREAILSGWITTGPRTKKLEAQISEYEPGNRGTGSLFESVALQSCFTEKISQL